MQCKTVGLYSVDSVCSGKVTFIRVLISFNLVWFSNLAVILFL